MSEEDCFNESQVKKKLGNTANNFSIRSISCIPVILQILTCRQFSQQSYWYDYKGKQMVTTILIKVPHFI